MLIVHPPNNRRRINKGVNLEMHAQSQDEACHSNPLPLHGPQQGHCQKAEQALGAASGADCRHHWIPQPDGGKRTGSLGAHAPLLPQHSDDQPSGEQVCQGKDDLAKGEELRRGGGDEQPGEERRVAVCFPGIGAEPMGHGAGGIGEDEVVDIGVFDGRVGVLPGAVEQENEAEEGSE